MTDRRFKVFGIGLSRTGTQSLTLALQRLGWNLVHYPVDRGTLETLQRGDARFPLLERCDGLSDITVAHLVADLDALHPGSRFVLTVRERTAWLASVQRHFGARPCYEPAQDEAHRVRLEIRRFLRAAVYGSLQFEPQRYARAYERHVDAVRRHFAGRPQQLLELDVCGGQGWERLAPFLGCEVPGEPFPHRGAG